MPVSVYVYAEAEVAIQYTQRMRSRENAVDLRAGTRNGRCLKAWLRIW